MENILANQYADTLKLQSLMDLVIQQYQHIIGENDRKKISAEDVLNYIVSYYENIISCMPGNIYWLDKHGITVGCNYNVLELFGFSSYSAFKGLDFDELGYIGRWSAEAIRVFKNDTFTVIKTGLPKLNIEEPPVLHVDGHCIYYLTSRVPLFDQAGEVIGVVVMSVDITAHKNAQLALQNAKEQAEAASLAKSEFMANMSHDVKTPLSGIIGITELLTQRLQGEEQKFAQSLLVSGRQLLNFFDNCLEVFKLENSDISAMTENFNLKTVINEIYDLYYPAVKKKGLTLVVHYDPHIPMNLHGSRAGIYRILLNLVGNAVKFTHTGSIEINVELTKQSNDKEAQIKFVVADTGIGIAKPKQQIIFERFTRLSPSYKGLYEGSGIGLHIVQKFVESMQGQIYVNSEEGRGSQFIVIVNFKVLQASELNITNEKIALIKPKFSPANNKLDKSLRILLVEDNMTAQWMQKSLLLSLGCIIDVADSGEEALEFFEPGKYNLVIMDIGLPGMQGDSVSEQIRKREQDSQFHVPIIALTAHTTDEIKQHCLNAGMENVFSKPLLLDQAKLILEQYYA